MKALPRFCVLVWGVYSYLSCPGRIGDVKRCDMKVFVENCIAVLRVPGLGWRVGVTLWYAVDSVRLLSWVVGDFRLVVVLVGAGVAVVVALVFAWFGWCLLVWLCVIRVTVFGFDCAGGLSASVGCCCLWAVCLLVMVFLLSVQADLTLFSGLV